jgi:hypothetical protein
MKRFATLALPILCLIALGCGRQAEVMRQEFRVGVHQASFTSRVTWQHVDQGDRHLLRRGEVELVVQDLGPVGRDGIRREVERARVLWLAGKVGEARTALRMIPVSQEHFKTPLHRTEFWEAWAEVSRAPDYLDTVAVDLRFRRVFEAVDSLRSRTVDALIADALKVMGEDRRRSIAGKVRSNLDGREVWVVETWNRLSHVNRERFALVLDDGYLLVLRTGRGPWPNASRDFEEVLKTLRIAPRNQSGVGVRNSSA